MEGKASVYQVFPVSRTTGEGTALGEGFVIRVVLGLGEGAGDGEEGGVRG